jgi:hypothetical protein
MNVQSKIAIFVIVLFSGAPAVQAQTHASTAAATGTVEGKVFAITRGGDLKPARMPTIYLLYKGQGEHLEANSADAHYQNASMAALQKRLDDRLAAARAGSVGDEDLECRESLLDKSLSDIIVW